MAFQFKKAERTGVFARLALDGVTGGGKTYTALAIAQGFLRPGQRVAFIDTERGSGLRYAPAPGTEANPEEGTFPFDHVNMDTYSPDTYVEALASVDPTVYGVTIVDSLSHSWAGKDGALEQVDKAAARNQSGNKFTAWRDVTPMHNRLVDALLSHPTHLIVTMRSKMAYELVENDRGKKEPKKLGLAPVQRDGIEYEFDIVGDMNEEGRLVISKTRASFLSGGVFNKPGIELGRKIAEWCGTVEPKVNDASLRSFANGKSTDEIEGIKTEVVKRFGKTMRELTVEQFNEFVADYNKSKEVVA